MSTEQTCGIETYQCDSVQDVDEKSEDLSVKVGRDEGAEGREEDDDRDANGQEPPTLQFGSGVGHELAPIKS